MTIKLKVVNSTSNFKDVIVDNITSDLVIYGCDLYVYRLKETIWAPIGVVQILYEPSNLIDDEPIMTEYVITKPVFIKTICYDKFRNYFYYT